MTVYHETTNAPVAIDRLCAELRRRAESLGTTMLQIGHRALATAIGCSASRIPALMQRLEDAGSIIRQPFKNGYVIDVHPLIDQPPTPDRSALADDRTPLIDQPPPDPALAQSNAPDRPATRNRIKNGCMDDHDSKTQEKESVRSPLFERLMQQPGMARSLALRIVKCPIGNVADFLHDLQVAQSIAGIYSPFFFTVARWRDGQRVVAPEEPQHESPARSRSATRARHGAQAHQSGGSPFDQNAATDYAALLAEIAACNPGMSV